MPSVAAFIAWPRRLRTLAVVTVAVLCTVTFVGWFALPRNIRQLFTVSELLTLLALLGLLVGVIVAVAASSVRADEAGLQIRNGLHRYRVPWSRVHKIIFRSGDPWAQLLLRPADGSEFRIDLDAEKRLLMGIQAVDGERARQAVEELRRRHREFLATR
jgi:Bacterial PH domain